MGYQYLTFFSKNDTNIWKNIVMTNTWYRLFIPPKQSCVIEVRQTNYIIEIFEYPFM